MFFFSKAILFFAVLVYIIFIVKIFDFTKIFVKKNCIYIYKHNATTYHKKIPPGYNSLLFTVIKIMISLLFLSHVVSIDFLNKENLYHYSIGS